MRRICIMKRYSKVVAIIAVCPDSYLKLGFLSFQDLRDHIQDRFPKNANHALQFRLSYHIGRRHHDMVDRHLSCLTQVTQYIFLQNNTSDAFELSRCRRDTTQGSPTGGLDYKGRDLLGHDAKDLFLWLTCESSDIYVTLLVHSTLEPVLCGYSSFMVASVALLPVQCSMDWL